MEKRAAKLEAYRPSEMPSSEPSSLPSALVTSVPLSEILVLKDIFEAAGGDSWLSRYS